MENADDVPAKRPAPKLVDRDSLDGLVGPSAVHQGLVLDAAALASPTLEELAPRSDDKGLATIVMLDQVTDPHNIGAILRSACVFGATGLVVQDRHAPPVTGALAKTASGAVEHVPIVRVKNLSRALDELRDAGFFSMGLAEGADQNLADIGPPKRLALVLGSEGSGLRRLVRERCDVLAAIPNKGNLASLNVSNAAAVALYAMSQANN